MATLVIEAWSVCASCVEVVVIRKLQYCHEEKENWIKKKKKAQVLLRENILLQGHLYENCSLPLLCKYQKVKSFILETCIMFTKVCTLIIYISSLSFRFVFSPIGIVSHSTCCWDIRKKESFQKRNQNHILIWSAESMQAVSILWWSMETRMVTVPSFFSFLFLKT